MSSIIDFTGFRTVYDRLHRTNMRQYDVLLVDFETGMVSTDTIEFQSSIRGFDLGQDSPSDSHAILHPEVN